MKKLLTLTLLLLLLHKLNAQTIHDSVFNNVILIKNINLIRSSNDFLIDVPIKHQEEPIIIFNDDKIIPTKLFFDRKSFLERQNEIFLITPDWEFRKEIIEKEKRTGLHIKASRHKIYHIQRNLDRYQVDSLVISLHTKPLVTLNFKKNEIVKGVVKDSIDNVVPGVSIIVENTNRGTYTDIDGKYSIEASPNDFLIFRYMGMKEQRIIADKNEINVQLMDDDVKLIEGSHYIPTINRKRKVNDITLEKNLNTKKISGVIFGDDLPIPFAEIQIKGTDKKTMSNGDGKFEIIASENQVLNIDFIGFNPKEIIITDKNCYKIFLTKKLVVDYPIFYSSKREKRKILRNERKNKRNIKRKIKKGFYDCLE